MSKEQGTNAVSVLSIGHKAKPLTTEVAIGKDILELLTGAMYNDPLTVFREYIQNSTDSIEDAVTLGQLSSMSDGKVEVWLDQTTRSILIRDNGIGIPNADFEKRLTAIGMSTKRGKHKRGFRGVGRLSGLGYCEEMIFRSRSSADTRPRELVWNGLRLKELLRDPEFSKPLGDAVSEVVTVRAIAAEGYPDSFFEVELRGVVRLRNDILLNEGMVRAFLSQVAPVGFAPGFVQSAEIESVLRANKAGQTISVEVKDGGGFVFRPHTSAMRFNSAAVSCAKNIESFVLEDIEGEIAAVGWLLHHDYLGAFPKTSLLGGLRVRVGNIQIGGDDLLEQIFSESRFNSWSIGEVHILSSKIVPNGRRDDFEANIHWHDLLMKLRDVATGLAKRCRLESQSRLAARRGLQLFEQIEQSIELAKTYSTLDVATEVIFVEIGEKFSELQKLASRQETGTPIKEVFDRWVDKLEKPIAMLKRDGARQNAFDFLPRNQRTTFKNALGLILTLSPDPKAASKLVADVISHARQSYA